MKKSYEESLYELMNDLYQLDGETDFSEIPELMAEMEEFMGELQCLQGKARGLLKKIAEYDENNYDGFLISNAGEFMVSYVDTFEECVEALHEVKDL